MIKALGQGLPPREIEILAGEPPHVLLHGRAAELAGETPIAVSLTHSRENAAAVAIAG
ncbi:MAG: hypothetical protein WBV53_04995 [Solirubrobacterales bacterium]